MTREQWEQAYFEAAYGSKNDRDYWRLMASASADEQEEELGPDPKDWQSPVDAGSDDALMHAEG